MNAMVNHPYIIFGASGHGKVIADILEKGGETIAAFIDDDSQKYEKPLLDYPVWSVESARKRLDMTDCLFVIGIGNNAVRKKVVNRLARLGARFGTAIHPTAVIGRDVVIGEGVVIMAQGVINTGSRIGEHTIINTSVSVDHDCQIGDFVHISPGARVGGTVTVHEETWLGIGSVILNNLTIGAGAVIGGGAVVIRDVEARTVVVGNPARPLRKSIE